MDTAPNGFGKVSRGGIARGEALEGSAPPLSSQGDSLLGGLGRRVDRLATPSREQGSKVREENLESVPNGESAPPAREGRKECVEGG